MHAAAINLRGGVSPRNTRLRGQSIIEYVLIIAVIGLLIVFAGPGVAGAIRNQFNQVTNTVDSGTKGDSFMCAEEKAYREAMKTVAAKDAKDWTLSEQKTVANDIAKNGTSSVVYAKAKAAMDAGTRWSMKLTNGQEMTYRIIGINHDDLAGGSGRAGLTFWASSSAFDTKCSLLGIYGNYLESNIRKQLNSGDKWNLLPEEFKSNIVAVAKKTCSRKRQIGAPVSSPTIETEKVFLPSYTETTPDSSSKEYSLAEYSWLSGEGLPYEGASSFRSGCVLRTPAYDFGCKHTQSHPLFSQCGSNTDYTENVEPSFCF